MVRFLPGASSGTFVVFVTIASCSTTDCDAFGISAAASGTPRLFHRGGITGEATKNGGVDHFASSSLFCGGKSRSSSLSLGGVSTTNGEGGTSEEAIKFYTLEGGMCPYAGRTWLVLEELGIPFDMIEVNTRSKPEWYLKLNPRGKVPAIQNTADGCVVYESAICNEYLSDLARQLDANNNGPSEKDQEKVWKLMPTNPSDRAAVRLLNDHVDTMLSPAQFTFLMNKDSAKDEELRQTLEDALSVIEKTLVKNGGPYLMGMEFTLADVHVLPFFFRLLTSLKHFKGYELSKEKYPALLDWYDLCSTRESVKTTTPSQERIIEVYGKFMDVNYAFGGLNKN